MNLLKNADAILSFDAWCQKRLGESPLFHFWHLVLSMELTILSLVRAFREANFTLYCQALCALIPFFFANNNVNYARCLPVHLKYIYQHPYIYQEFQSGKFIVFKSSRPFSAMAIDQLHEQANAVIKGECGATGVNEAPAAFRRWMIAGGLRSAALLQNMKLSLKLKIKMKIPGTMNRQHMPKEYSFKRRGRCLMPWKKWESLLR